MCWQRLRLLRFAGLQLRLRMRAILVAVIVHVLLVRIWVGLVQCADVGGMRGSALACAAGCKRHAAGGLDRLSGIWVQGSCCECWALRFMRRTLRSGWGRSLPLDERRARWQLIITVVRG